MLDAVAQKRLTDFFVETAPKILTTDEIRQMVLVVTIYAACERYLEARQHETQATY